jgi:hypothetical protein
MAASSVDGFGIVAVFWNSKKVVGFVLFDHKNNHERLRIMRRKKIITCVAFTSVSLLAACGSKSKTTKSPSVAQPSSLSDLKLSKALQVSLTGSLQKAAGVKSGQASLGLAEKKKSTEACEALQMIDVALLNARSNGSFLCHMEAEKLEFGKKYNAKFINSPDPEGNAEGQIWVDNSNPENLKVYLCIDKKLAVTFNVSGYGGEGLVKGSSQFKFGDDYTANDEFDFTSPGVKVIKSSALSKSSVPENAYQYQQYQEINLIDSGVSSLLVSKGGNFGTFNFDEQAAVLFNGTVGQALYKNSSGFTRATFDAEGYKVSSSGAIGDVVIDKTKLPAKLPSTFSPEQPSGWDCSTTESVTVDLSDQVKKAAHDACDIEEPEFDSCFDPIFEDGDPEQ